MNELSRVSRQLLSVALLTSSLAAAAAAQEFAAPDLASFLKKPSGGAAISDRAIERFLYAGEDETDVLKEPRNGDDGLLLTQLRRGEKVKILGELDDEKKVHWYKVEAPRREFDEGTGGWRNTEGWVRGSRTDPATRRSVEALSDDARIARRPVDLKAGPCREAFVKAMESFLGVPYRWGGTSRRGVDCSGLVQTAMIEAGCARQTPPRTAADQFRASLRRSSPDEMKDGDLVFLRNKGGKVHHVIGFIGDGKVIEAPRSGSVVSISELNARLRSAAARDDILFGSLLGD